MDEYPVCFVKTVKERCRVCYTCVRECPSKAIRIADGQAEVLSERCIGCGNCVQVCSQKAKEVISTMDYVEALLKSGAPTAACVAPSFPAEFEELDYPLFVGMIRALGFKWVVEVAFGADLTAQKYRALLERPGDEHWISSACPAVIGYVERYRPELLSRLAPLVSPMVATGRALKKLHGSEIRTVFIGPCIAKKCELGEATLRKDVSIAITFVELRRLFAKYGIAPERTTPSDFDPPRPRGGALFPLNRGLLETAGIHEDLMRNEVVSACGKKDFVGALREFQKGQLSVRLLDILCCDGCIMGSRMTTKAPLYKRRALVAAYARRRAAEGKTAGPNDFDAFKDLDLSRTFMRRDQRRLSLSEEQMNEILRSMGKLRVEDELNCGACGYETCRAHARAIGWGLAEKEMCLPYNIEQLHTAIGNLASTNEQLAGTREALVQSERLANMGQLAAGIAHEVNNPLGVVLIYAHLLLDRVKVDPQLQEDLTMIVDQADRCKRIVSGLLNFARKSRISLRETNVRELVGRALKAVTVPADVVENIEHAERDPLCEMDPDQMLQVLTNLLDNACAAMPYGGSLLLRTEGNESAVRFIVADSGMGIPRENLNKIFEPFFTTKQIGKGTGLGLAVTYGIVKMHRGDISVKSNVEPNLGPTGTTFTVTIPRKGLPET